MISWLMNEEGLSLEEGFTDVVSRRDCVMPNHGFCDQLTIFQDQCGSRLENYTANMFMVCLLSNAGNCSGWLTALSPVFKVGHW